MVNDMVKLIDAIQAEDFAEIIADVTAVATDYKSLHADCTNP